MLLGAKVGGSHALVCMFSLTRSAFSLRINRSFVGRFAPLAANLARSIWPSLAILCRFWPSIFRVGFGHPLRWSFCVACSQKPVFLKPFVGQSVQISASHFWCPSSCPGPVGLPRIGRPWLMQAPVCQVSSQPKQANEGGVEPVDMRSRSGGMALSGGRQTVDFRDHAGGLGGA